PAARHRRLVDKFYVPLAELSALGMNDLQRRSDIAPLYSQSAGLASFFMDYQGGKHRRAFTETLRIVYAGRDGPDTIAAASGASFDQLDAEYLDFLSALPSPQAVSATTPSRGTSAPGP
ncbi:MAG: hypothetical protein AAF961_07515, partial [Planctomycetota bacterium]